MGVDGVAYATVIAQFSTVVVGLVMVRVHLKPIGGQFVTSRILEGKSVRRMLQINGDIFIRSILVQGCFAAITVLGARFGEMTLATNAILFNFLIFIAYILDGYSHAAETLVGEAIGARNAVSFHKAVGATVRGALIWAVILTVLFWSAGSLIIDIITTVEGVRNLTRSYLPWMVAMPLISVWSFLLDGIFIGGTWSRQMRNGMIQAALIYAAALAVFVPIWGNHGIWLAVTFFLVARAFTLALPYRRLVKTVGKPRS